MIREVGESIGEAVAESVGRAVGRAQETRPLPSDLLESDEAFLAVFDAPGADPADVQVQFDDGRLEVRIDRFREFHEGYEMRFPGRGLTLEGHVRLPRDAAVDPASAAATVRENGTLEVRVPKVAGEVHRDAIDEADAEDYPGDEEAEDDSEAADAVDDEADETGDGA
ncbi:Hsp20 family protein [Halobacteriales archaeon Cl-PHB]